jgi:hypothetical protein
MVHMECSDHVQARSHELADEHERQLGILATVPALQTGSVQQAHVGATCRAIYPWAWVCEPETRKPTGGTVAAPSFGLVRVGFTAETRRTPSAQGGICRDELARDL